MKQSLVKFALWLDYDLSCRAAVKTFWQTKIWKSKDETRQSSQGSMRTIEESSGQTPTANASQSSQLEATVQEQGYQEWNADEAEN